MKFFTDGYGHVARVHTDTLFGPDFGTAKAQTYRAGHNDWRDGGPGLTSELRFSGDWEPCSDDDAAALMAAARQAHRQLV